MHQDAPQVEAAEPPYEPPQVEQVVTAQDLIREVQYAGINSLNGFLDF